MPVFYSHSKLSTFEQCPLKFKYRYIDKTPYITETIERHLGSVVHSTLEWIYTQVKSNKIPTINELIDFYTSKWKEDFNDNIVIVKKQLSIEDYFSKGIKFVMDYYVKHKPFNDNTIEIEKKIIIDLDEENKYKIQGFIDRLSYNRETEEYEIHDYKTSDSMPNKEKINNDRQLALYSIAIKDLFGKDKKICLVWHYLAHNQKICLRKNNNELLELKKRILRQIKEIESTEKFPPYVTVLCNWCDYHQICYAWN